MTTGWVMLASLLTLAIVEHALMMFPLPLQRIWGWARMQYRKAGGKFGPDTRPLDGDLYASCLEGGKAAVEQMKKDLKNFRASKLA